MRSWASVAVVSLALTSAIAGASAPRRLTFEERVRAQEAIERVYYKHQIGATSPFDAAVPRAVLESRVRTYLEQSAALASDWKTAVTDRALQREIERMARDSQMPERLQELFAALGNDPFLIKECVARATLVDRLTRNFEMPEHEPPSTATLMPQALRSAVAATGDCLVDGWDNGSLDDGPEPLEAPGSVWTGSEMLVWSGVNGSRGWRYDPTIDHWRPMSIAGAPSLRFWNTVVWTGSSMIAWGGRGNENPYPALDTGGRYDPIADAWTPTATTGAPAARSGHTAVWSGSTMIVWGGSDANGGLTSGGRYDPASDTWAPTAVVGAPSARSSHGAVWTGSRMIVFGGSGFGGPGAENTGGRYDPVSDTWASISTSGAPSVYFPTAVWTGNTMIAWDSFDGGRYNPVSDSWLPMSSANAPSQRRDYTAVWTGSAMTVWGGRILSGGSLGDGARYDPVADQWSTVSSVGSPGARSGHTAVWTGQLMVVWGGYVFTPATGFTNSLSTGGRYDPATDSWTPTSTGPSGAPSPRSGHTAVWTGNQMLIWGGDATEPWGRAPLGTGGRYDPATDSWTPISNSNAPSPRVDHTTVWTGSAMVVWGGHYFDVGNDHLLNTGGRYDPIANSWTPTSTAGAAVARYWHTAVWTGSKMVVWGGIGDLGNGDEEPMSTGGRYDPTTDTWTATSTTGAPSARWTHSAVWTGSTMVVWSGGYLGSEGSTGGRYDPASNTWAPTSTTGAPVARSNHNAIWTGTAMLVWGGEADSSPFDGGSYDPLSDAWQPISRTGQPAALLGGSAVWTGSEMVIWGGRAAEPTPLGGRYNPSTDTWRATTTIGAPSGRYDHTAIWTGSRMVVWGGARIVKKLATGGVYLMDDVATEDCDGDGFTVLGGDCNDADPSVHPGATETCNHVDEDCDNVIDDGGDALCDDGNPCTSDACEPLGGCVNLPEPAGTSCDDNNICDGNDTCDGYGYCYSDFSTLCGPTYPCILGGCNPLTGCTYDYQQAGTSCTDGNACNGAELCDGYGMCLPGTPVPVPPEVSGVVAAADKVSFAWTVASDATAYDAARGLISALPVGPGAADELCFGNLPGASLNDPNVPASGVAYWYLARGRNTCAGPGSYGTRSNGSPRSTTTCP